MIRANRRIKQDIKSGMFVALLYAVLDAEKGTVGMCSAGQTQPLLLSAKTAEANLVETVGDTFPLGILDEANYEETQLKMEPGDKVVYYTDGIVEAMNKNEDMYGFERLHEVVKSSQAETAEALMNDIISSVSDFTGAAPQHDDLTIIVVSADK
jgi:sigma-B regulation protein RsbU (phosphoserine phosphatase)